MNALEKILVATAALATLGATGLASTQASACNYGYGYSLPSYEAHELDGDCIRYRPTYDDWGNYIGRRPVNVCD